MNLWIYSIYAIKRKEKNPISKSDTSSIDISYFSSKVLFEHPHVMLNDIDRIDGNLQRRKWACKYTENKFSIWNIIISIYWRVIWLSSWGICCLNCAL